MIKPSKMSVSGISNIQSGAVAIRCESDEARKIIVNDIREKVSEKSDIKLPSMIKPKTLIIELPEKLEGKIIAQAMKIQNNLQDSYIKCLKVYKSYINPAVPN